MRREARELALKCLFQWDQRRDDGQQMAEALIREWTRNADAATYCRKLLKAYWERESEIDELIKKAADKWRLERMSAVDRSVLRLATTEMCYFPEVPPRVVLDEAIELAKSYSTEKSGAFVNGILDRILSERKLEADGIREVVRPQEE